MDGDGTEDSFMNRLPNVRGFFNDIRTALGNRGDRIDRNNQRFQEPLVDNMGDNDNNPALAEVSINDLLLAYPLERANTNKVALPHSILEELMKKNAFENRPANKPIIFNLSVADPDSGDIIAETHVGVDDFTAEKGKIGLPYKAALSLTKERGVGWLKENPQVFLTYMNIETYPETKMLVQPRGKGFHNDDQSVVNIDLKSILERTLKTHFVLTVEDWIPLFHEGRRFELVVQDLEPNEVIDVLNTDLTVELLPAEETAEQLEAQKIAEEKLKEFMSSRESRYKEKLAVLEKIPEPDKAAKGTYVMCRLRLPKGGAPKRMFSLESQYGLVLDWAETELYKSKFLPKVLPPEDAEHWFKLASSLPGKKKVSFTSEDAWKPMKQLLEENKMKAGAGLALMVEMIKFDEGGEQEEEEENPAYNENINNEWLRMANRLEINIEKSLEEENQPAEEPLSEEEIEEIKTRVEALGIDEGIAREVARMYGRQVRELETMGYSSEQIAIAIPLLIDMNGRLHDVINALLSNEHLTSSED